MNTLNALGFLICGLGMILVSSLAPNLFSAGVMPENSSRVWVEFMGLVNGLMGGGYLLVNRTLAFIRSCLAIQLRHTKNYGNDGLLRPSLRSTADIGVQSAHRKAA